MTETKIYEELCEIFQDFFADSSLQLRPETSAKDVEGWDSLNHLSLMISIESRFNIKFQTFEIEKLTNIADLVAMIEKKLGTS